jgi:hypothetical protein
MSVDRLLIDHSIAERSGTGLRCIQAFSNLHDTAMQRCESNVVSHGVWIGLGSLPSKTWWRFPLRQVGVSSNLTSYHLQHSLFTSSASPCAHLEKMTLWQNNSFHTRQQMGNWRYLTRNLLAPSGRNINARCDICVRSARTDQDSTQASRFRFLPNTLYVHNGIVWSRFRCCADTSLARLLLDLCATFADLFVPESCTPCDCAASHVPATKDAYGYAPALPIVSMPYSTLLLPAAWSIWLAMSSRRRKDSG